jgi:AhpD family alkylhydroperoxidase
VEPRMKHPGKVIPGVMQAIQGLKAAIDKGGLAPATQNLVHLRVSQINGCSPCVVGGFQHARQQGETDERLAAVAAWREAPYFTDAERGALVLAEAVTRLSDRADPVPDDVWEQASKQYSEEEMAALLLLIALANVFNRLNLPTRQVACAWG